jgi:sugar/nucleoside kinase (ribokinase family)
MIPDLVTVGGLTIDNVIAADGTVALARVGGNAAYSGVGARCWVGTVGLVSMAVSSYPKQTLARLAADGFLLDGVTHHPAVLRYVDWFIYDAAGDRHERLRSLPEDLAAEGLDKERLTPAEVQRWIAALEARPEPPEPSYSQFRHATPMSPGQVPAAYLKARGVHLAPCRIDVLEAMAAHFAPAGMPMTLDPGWQIANLPLDRLGGLLAAVDAFLPSEVELKALVPGASVSDALRELSRRCRGAVAVKRGGKGSLVWDRAKAEAVAVPISAAQAVDPTGAGDAWSGGFLAGLVETADPVRAAHFGAVSAARVVSRFGADGALPVDQAACRAALRALMRNIDRTES